MTREGSAAFGDRRRLGAVFGISGCVLVLEVVGGVMANSLALLADAGHVFTDLAGLALGLAAIWVAQRPATSGRTFGLYRAEILAAAVDAVLLLGVAGLVLVEAWRRLLSPPEVSSGLMLAVGTAGLVANGASLLLLRGAQGRSLNLRGAYLEVLGDLAGGAGVVVAALLIAFAGVRAADALASAFVGLLILPRTWGLLRDAMDVLLEATPHGVDLRVVRDHIRAAPGVRDVHDLHAWTITSGLNVVSAHVVIAPDAESPKVLDELCRCLSGDFDIEHSTFQLEREDRRRLEERTHA